MDQSTEFTSTYPLPNRPRKKPPLRVFLVEDLPMVRNRVVESLEEIDGLELAGFAESEDGALSWLHSQPCDVVILDLELRQGNGLGVLKDLAQHAPRPGLVKIVYSNHAGTSVRKAAAQLGASFFFDKTLDTPKLRPLLEKLSAARAS
jgi:two-component system, OmpR family, response regulator